VTVAKGFVKHINEPKTLGKDYKRGHEKLGVGDDMSIGDFSDSLSVTSKRERTRIEGLCASTGVINIGVRDSTLYIKYKWAVGVVQNMCRT
jgi:hypothetical protein